MLFRARQIVFFRQKPMSVLFHKSRGFTKTWTQIWFAGPRGFDYFMLRYVCKVHKPMDTPTNDLCFVTKGLGDVVKQNIYDVNMCVSCTWNVCFPFVLTKHNLWNSCVCHFLALPKITICWICVSMYSGTIVKQTPPATIFLRWIGPEIWTYHDSSPLKFHDTLTNLIHRRSQITFRTAAWAKSQTWFNADSWTHLKLSCGDTLIKLTFTWSWQSLQRNSSMCVWACKNHCG